MSKKKLLIFSLSYFLISCGAQPQFYQEKVSSHKEIAKLYLAERRYSEALKELELAKKTDKCDAETFNLIGLIYLEKRDFSKAEEAFREALKLDPTSSETYNNLGSLYLLQNQLQQAIYYFEKALSNPFYSNNYLTLTNLGWSYYKLGDRQKAEEYLLKALKENPSSAKALIYLSLIQLEEGNLQMAEAYLKRALKNDRSSIEARYYLAEVFFRQGNLEKAKSLWESILLLDPTSQWRALSEEKLMLLDKLSSSK